VRRWSRAALVCALLAVCLAVPGTALGAGRSYVGATVPDSSAVGSSFTSAIGSPQYSLETLLSLQAFGASLVKPASGAAVALEPGRVGLPWRDANRFWVGPYLHICGVIYNPYDYPVYDLRVTYTASVNGVEILNETNYAAGYVLYNEEDAAFEGVFYLPQYAGQALSSCTIYKSAMQYSGPSTVLLTDVRYARTVAPTGERTYSVVFRNDSTGYVARPVFGGWEIDSTSKLIDTMFDFSTALIPPGATVTMNGVAFYPNFTPTDFDYYAEAEPVTVHNVSVFPGPNGTTSPGGTSVVEDGKNATITITPNPGYTVDEILVDGAPVSTLTPCVLTGVVADHAVVVTFKLKTKASMSAPVAPATMYYKKLATVYGYVAPAHTAGSTLVTMKCYLRNSSGKYVYHHSFNIAGTYYSDSKTKYSARFSLPHRGRWRVRAYHSDASHLATYSSYDYITVK